MHKLQNTSLCKPHLPQTIKGRVLLIIVVNTINMTNPLLLY